MTPNNNQPVLRSDFQLVAPIDEEKGPATEFRLRRFWTFLRRYWWLPVATLTVCVAAAVASVLNTAPTFVSHARMWETVKVRLPESELFTEDVQNFLGTQRELLQSATLRNLALQRLNESGQNAAPALAGGDKAPPVTVRVAETSRSSVFTLEASGPDASYTRAYLNALMSAYLDYKKDIRKMVSGDTLASITEQVQRAERDLNAAQDASGAFGQTNNLAILQQEAQMSAAYLARLKTQLSDLELENKLLGAVPTETQLAAGNSSALTDWVDPGMITGSDTGNRSSPDVLRAVQEVEMLKMQRAKLSGVMRPQHPRIVKLDADIERGEKFLEIFRRYNREQLAAMRQANEMKIQNVEASIQDWERTVLDTNSRIAQAEHLKLNVDRAQTVYDRLAKLAENLTIGGNLDQETLAILEPAGPALRSYQKEARALVLALFGGVAVGAGLLLMLMARDDRFVTFSEVNERLSEDILSQVPAIENTSANKARGLLEISDPRHAYAESFRSLRSALLFMEQGEDRPRVVLVTSALPYEGKSTVAANLARALALGGSRVALVDADLHKGVLHELLKLKREPGLTDALRDGGELKPVLQTNSMPNLVLISCGKRSADGGDLFLGRSFDRLLTQLRAQFDYVIIDSSPVFATDDAPTLAPKVDGTLFVVRSRYSRGRAVREALNILYQRNARVLGLVFNHVDPAERSYYHYKYAEYYPASNGTAANHAAAAPAQNGL